MVTELETLQSRVNGHLYRQAFTIPSVDPATIAGPYCFKVPAAKGRLRVIRIVLADVGVADVEIFSKEFVNPFNRIHELIRIKDVEQNFHAALNVPFYNDDNPQDNCLYVFVSETGGVNPTGEIQMHIWVDV